MQIYLSIHRPDLARKELDRAKRWAEDDLLLQLIESSIGLVTGKDGYADCNSFYTEQLANPSLSSPHVLTARGITRLLRGEISAANSDFEEAVSQQGGKADVETLAAMTVAAGLGAPKGAEADLLFRYVNFSIVIGTLSADGDYSRLAAEYPSHPLVADVQQKAALFDECAAKFTVPVIATAA